MNTYFKVIVLLVLAGLVIYLAPLIPSQQDEQGVEEGFVSPEVVIDTPQIGQLVSSPLKVSGKAKGTWFFEANIVVILKDEKGNILTKQGFMTSDEWMNVEYAGFEGMLEFAVPDMEFGVLLIEKDNPSGLAEFDASFAVPVRFR